MDSALTTSKYAKKEEINCNKIQVQVKNKY